MHPSSVLAIALLLVLVVLLAVALWRQTASKRQYERRFAGVLDADAEIARLGGEKADLQREIDGLRSSYREKKAVFDSLIAQAAVYDEELQLAELGFYKPHFDFDASDKYKEQLEVVKSRQKTMISKGSAISCDKEWVVDGSKAKGRTMTNRGIRITARAFNNECDAAMGNVRWNNAERMEQRVRKAFDALNKLNESSAIRISSAYLNLKLDELRLTHEYHEKRQREKEEQADIRRQMREEAKLEQEREQAAREEAKYQRLLDKAKGEVEKASGDQLQKLEGTIASLQQELAQAQEKSARATSMAEQTRMGHVYVISNVGSFGQDVFKIGMTRRLDPLERVKELGDASVPFVFDVHAMIFAEDAPSIERALHDAFDSRRLNMVNSRKEFFAVGLDEIKQETKKLSPEAEFIETAEAREYRESQSIRQQRKESGEREDARKVFPSEI